LVIAAGVAYFAAAWISGDPWFGLALLIFMLLCTVGFVITSRHSETVRGLMDRRDERISQMDLVATAVAGSVVLYAVIVLLIIDLAHDRYDGPYAALGALGGVTYAVTLLVQRLRK
jgi:hypothetical protein